MGLPIAHDLIDVSVLDTGGLLGVVVAYGRLIPVSLLAHIPMINLHFSLLPRWRGAAPVERAILAGDRTTGACIMRVMEGLDTGEVYRRCEIDIGDTETAVELRNRLLNEAIPLLLDVVTNGAGAGVRQTGQATYATKIVSDDLAFDWRLSAEQLSRIARIGVGHTKFRGKRLNIRNARVISEPVSLAPGEFLGVCPEGIIVSTGQGSLCLLSVQPEGKPTLDAVSWARGARLERNERFG
jgi:methionyl-tRNA formyltransferase